jgi:hypothetical protein
MSISRVRGPEVISVGYKGLGVAFAVEEGKLIPLGNSESNDSAEYLLNKFRVVLQGYADDSDNKLTQAKAIREILGYLVDKNPEQSEEQNLYEKLNSLDEALRTIQQDLAVVRLLIVEVTDLLSEFGLSIQNLDGSVIQSETQVTSLFDRLKGSK